MVAEELLKDFTQAAHNVFAMIEKEELKSKRFSSHAGPAVATLF
jgi:hypothetical protein